MHKSVLTALGGALLLSACATGRDRNEGPEFIGRTLRVEAANGQVTDLAFRGDGTVVAKFGKQETRGRWDLERRQLCFTWAGSFRECWPYTERFRRGETVSLTSSRGNRVRVTMR